MSRVKTKFKMFFVLAFAFSSFFHMCSATNVMKINSTTTKKRAIDHSHKEFLEYQALDGGNNATDYLNDISYIPNDLQIVLESLETLNATSNCVRDAMIVLESIRKREKWALKMFDASAKFPIGILYGAHYQFGNFDECISIKEAGIQGQYCLLDIGLGERVEYNGRVPRSYENLKAKNRNAFDNTLHWSICVPASCKIEEVQTVVKDIFTKATNHKGLLVSLDENKCHTEQELPFTPIEIIYCCFLVFCLFFIFAVSIYHYYSIEQKKKTVVHNLESAREKNQNSAMKEGFLCFSLIKNVTKFLHVKPSNLNLECICGIRFLSMGFIIAGHSLLFMIGGPTQNSDFYIKESANFMNAIFTNSPLLVDTFLFISGFLMCYLLLIELDKRRGRVNVLVLYIARYIRLTPSYLVVIGVYCSVLYRMGSGPLWDSRIQLEQERCLKSWWVNLLYLNNYVNTDYACMFQSWYLAVDYHLFIIAPFIIYPLWRFHRLGKCFLGFCIITSVIIPFWITMKNELDPTFLSYAPEVQDISTNFYFKTAYIKTHMRASSYIIGLLFGFIIYKIKTKGIKIPKYVIWSGWFTCIIGGVLSLFSVTIFYMPQHRYDAFESAVYAALHRVAWCISIGWIIIMCVTDNAAIINKFLSWKPFIPLSRLTYCAYLINGFVEILNYGTIRSGIHMSKLELGNKVISHGLITFALAFLLCILFESPIHGLEKILLRRERKPKTDHSNNVPENNAV